MDIKAYLRAALVVPSIGLILILFSLLIDVVMGDVNLLQEYSNGRGLHLLFAFLTFVSICFASTFFIALFSTLFINLSRESSRAFLSVGALVGGVIAVLSLYFMDSGNLTRESGLYLLTFIVIGLIFGWLTAKVYSKSLQA